MLPFLGGLCFSVSSTQDNQERECAETDANPSMDSLIAAMANTKPKFWGGEQTKHFFIVCSHGIQGRVLPLLTIELRQGRSVHHKNPQIPGKWCCGRKTRKIPIFCSNLQKSKKNWANSCTDRAQAELSRAKPSTSRAQAEYKLSTSRAKSS